MFLSQVKKGVSRVYASSAPNWFAQPRCCTVPRLTRVFGTVPQPASSARLSESFLNGTSAPYVEQMYDAWRKDPNSVHKSWDAYFRNVDSGLAPGQAFQLPPSPSDRQGLASLADIQRGSDAGVLSKTIADNLKVILLIRAYQVRGHVIADLDPLGMTKYPTPPELELSTYGFSEADLDREFAFDIDALTGFMSGSHGPRKLRDIINQLKRTYCGHIGVEYMHIQNREQCNWIRSKFETPTPYQFSKEDKLNILDRLAWATAFEQFLHIKYKDKRFGLDGCESLIPGMKSLIDQGADLGLESIVVGMPHRGRLNVLANVVRKPVQQIFHEFEGIYHKDSDEFSGSGDVKYHLGTSYDRPTRGGKKVHLSLVANPSHLEAVDPVVEGKVRAKQHFANDHDRSKIMSLLLHGDASFAGQGIVYETLDLSGLPGYTTGGTVHIIVNNQIGFTTDPKSSRHSMYCTDVAKCNEAPIFHVNGDDPEAVVKVCQLAVEWRQTFHKDAVVDIVCYRRFGHNEQDEPMFTQPLMYKNITAHPPAVKLYAEKLIQEGLLTKEGFEEMTEKPRQTFAEQYALKDQYKPKMSDWLSSKWEGFKSPAQMARILHTGVPVEVLKTVGNAITTVPAGFTLHKQLEKQLQAKKKMFETGEGIDWGTAEALAFGTLLLENNLVRLSGQDVERGTFSHRHAVLHDQQTNATYCPLNHIKADQAPFQVTNSSLSEFAVLGFEHGFSLESPNALVIWEAQFGDFANGAQVVFDQFISSGEQKWMRQSGLVMLLPHGYDGQGPEHSSARLERFLQMGDSNPTKIPILDEKQTRQVQESNWQVVNCTTPANFFHCLRRQLHREFRKPLVVMSPKSLLKHKLAVSNLSEFTDSGEHTRFKMLIPEAFPDEISAPKQVKKLIFCSGKVYYDLLQERRKRTVKDTAIVRIEQLAPFPFDKVQQQVQLYPNAKIVWAQEEPMNMGAWTFVYFHFLTAFKEIGVDQIPTFVGRATSASPATGSKIRHQKEVEKLLDDAFAPL